MTLRRWRGIVVGLTLVGAFALSASPAVAKPCHGHHSPHGNSEADQYSESVPGPCGDQPIGGNGAGQGGGAGSSHGAPGSSSGVPSASVSQLNHMGPAGVAAANLAESTSPLGPGANGGGGGKGGGAKGSTAHGGSSGHGSGASQRGTAAAGSTTSDGGGGGLSDAGNPIGALASLVTGGSGNGFGSALPILLIAILLGGLGFLVLMRTRTE